MLKRRSDGSDRESKRTSTLSFLIADDFEPWRAQVRSLLQEQPEWEIVCEVSDGSEAVEKAAELQPDVVILDVAMSRMSGIEAAKLIRESSPDSKIIFLSQQCDQEIVNAALATGAEAFISKTDAARRLIPAISEVLLRVL